MPNAEYEGDEGDEKVEYALQPAQSLLPLLLRSGQLTRTASAGNMFIFPYFQDNYIVTHELCDTFPNIKLVLATHVV
jgi:hypothetical protein